MTSLDAVRSWDVATVAAAVVDADGVRERIGPTDAPFALASVTKVLAAVAVHVAVEEGTVSLDDGITAVGGPPGATVRHLLAHASGLPPDGDRTPLGPPGRRRIYSNVGFEVLADHVAAAAGMPFADYARVALVDALDLASTATDGSAAHAFRSSVDDLAAVLGAVVGGRLLAAETVAAMTAVAFPGLAGVLPGFGAQDPNPWGLGVEVRGSKSPHWTAPEASAATWGHFGRSGTFLWWDPDAHLGLVVLTDRDFGPWAVAAWPALASGVLAEHR